MHLLRLRIGHQAVVELEPILGLIGGKGEVVSGVHAVAGVHNSGIEIIVHGARLLERVGGADLNNHLEEIRCDENSGERERVRSEKEREEPLINAYNSMGSIKCRSRKSLRNRKIRNP